MRKNEMTMKKKLMLLAGLVMGSAQMYGAAPKMSHKHNARKDGCALVTAVQYGDVHRTRMLLDAGADGSQEVDGCTALMWAAHRGDSELVQALLTAGAQIDARRKTNLTALIIAIWFERADIVRTLIEAGADMQVVVKGKSGEIKNPLIYAAEKGHCAIVQMLIDAGVQMHEQIGEIQFSGLVALSKAVENGHHEVAQVLIDTGYTVDNELAAYLLKNAQRGRHEQCIRLIKDESSRGNTPLHIACAAGYGARNMAECLTQPEVREAIADIDVTQIPIGALTRQIQQLIHRDGADLEAVNKAGDTARQYIQLREWLTRNTIVKVQTMFDGREVSVIVTRGTKISQLKHLIATVLTTPENRVQEIQLRVIRHDNKLEAFLSELVGATTQFHAVVDISRGMLPQTLALPATRRFTDREVRECDIDLARELVGEESVELVPWN